MTGVFVLWLNTTHPAHTAGPTSTKQVSPWRGISAGGAALAGITPQTPPTATEATATVPLGEHLPTSGPDALKPAGKAKPTPRAQHSHNPQSHPAKLGWLFVA